MDKSSDTEVLRAAIDWLDEGNPVTLVTVARTWGSSPRRPGAMMAIHADGRFVGSVSGGCVEDELVQQTLKGAFEDQPPAVLEFGVTREDTQRVGLPCGGRLTVAVEYITAQAQLQKLWDTLQARQRITRRVCLNTGEASLHSATADTALTYDGNNLIKTFGPSWRLLLIGAGELTRRVAQLALTLDYAVTICDPRPEYAHDWQVEGSELVTEAPDKALADLHPDSRTAILALSHTPALDDAVLANALRSDAFYIGALGSQKTQSARRERLKVLGLTTDQLARMNGPVGLEIGSRTPAEIAIAICAALIAERKAQAQSLALAQSAYA